jgi:hypothetical protein
MNLLLILIFSLYHFYIQFSMFLFYELIIFHLSITMEIGHAASHKVLFQMKKYQISNYIYSILVIKVAYIMENLH